MNVSFPLEFAWSKMVRDLFKPFILEKWFVVGFTAFLAALGGGGSNRFSVRVPSGNAYDMQDVLEVPSHVWEWLQENPVWMIAGIVASCILFVLWIVFLWLSSRGKFMFLDNVIHSRWHVVAPWRDFKSLGDSLFKWRLSFALVGFLVFAVWGVFLAWPWLRRFTESDSSFSIGIEFLEVFLVFLLIGVLFLAISVALDDFVVPIMARNHLTCLAAWRKFLDLFLAHKLGFALYGLLVLGLGICAGVAIILVGMFTCCCGFLIMAVPYVGTVVTLPIPYFFRTFSIAFLAQFGNEFDVLDVPQVQA